MANKLGIETNPAPHYPQAHNKRELKLAETIREDKNLTDTFDQALNVSLTDNTDGTAYTGATAEVVAFSSGKAAYECYQAAVAVAAVVTPHQSADGLEIKPVAAADALEIGLGPSSRSRGARTVGTDDRFYMQGTFTIDDISDVTELWFGWRKAEAYQADPDNYDEAATLCVGLGADGRFNITTILNNAATVTTNTGATAWIDAGTHTLRVEISEQGAAKFLVDGTAYATASYTFDDGEVVIPFIHLDTETGDPGVSCSSLKIGKM